MPQQKIKLLLVINIKQLLKTKFKFASVARREREIWSSSVALGKNIYILGLRRRRLKLNLWRLSELRSGNRNSFIFNLHDDSPMSSASVSATPSNSLKLSLTPAPPFTMLWLMASKIESFFPVFFFFRTTGLERNTH